MLAPRPALAHYATWVRHRRTGLVAFARTFSASRAGRNDGGVDIVCHFDNTGNMEIGSASKSLAALGHGTRLALFRLLVQAGPEGMNAGLIGDRLELAPATLSFHLAHLSRVGLIRGRQEGRFIFYVADYVAMNALLGFLTDNCCQGAHCLGKTTAIPQKQRRPASARSGRV